MFTQQEKMAMLAAFDKMSPHDQVTIHALIHDRSKTHVPPKTKNASTRLFGSKLGGSKD